MAGGTWMSQNKKIPGVYINTQSTGLGAPSMGEKGVVAIGKALKWGPSGVIEEYIPGQDSTPLIGYDITSNEALFLREMCKGSDVTGGPIKILLYRLPGTGFVKATATVGALTATAKYAGSRGNDITIVIAANADTPTDYDIETVVDGAVVHSQTLNDLDNLVSNDWVDFTGTGTTITTTAGTALTGGADGTFSLSDYSSFFTALEPYTFDIICDDVVDPTISSAMASFVQRVSQNLGKKCQAVMAGATAMNSEWVINLNNGVELSDGTQLTNNLATYWLAGAEAGAMYNQSLTYAQYPGAVAAYPKKTEDQVIAAVEAGDVVFIDDFDIVKVCTDINTLTTYTPTKGAEYSKNRVMRVLNQICNDVYKYCSLYIIGKVDNNDTGRNLLKGWIVGYLNEMQANNGIQNFAAEDVTVEPGNTIDAILVTIGIQPVDSIEKIYVTVNVSVLAA